MIGRWLELLTKQEEDNLLTTQLVPFTAHAENRDMGCLVGVALKHRGWGSNNVGMSRLWYWWNGRYHEDGKHSVAWRFNELCQKLVGVPRSQRRVCGYFMNGPLQLLGGASAAALIRARILRNRARRALSQQEVPNAKEPAYSH